MILQFTPQEISDAATRIDLAASQRALAVIEAVRHSAAYVTAHEAERQSLEAAMLRGLGSHAAPSWKELLLP